MNIKQWFETNDQKKLRQFQDICAAINFPPPKDKRALDYVFNSFSFCQALKDYQMTFDEIKLISECIFMDKYYVDKLIMFPDLYLCTNDEKGYYDMNDTEKAQFAKDASECLQTVCQNQRELFNNDISMKMIEVHLPHLDQRRNNQQDIETTSRDSQDDGPSFSDYR